MSNGYYGSYIVPLDPSPTISRAPAQSYEIPWWGDTINRAIERAAQVVTVQTAGYPPYPQMPVSAPTPMPYPPLGVQPQAQPREGIQLSQTTLMLLVGGVLLFMLGGRRK